MVFKNIWIIWGVMVHSLNTCISTKMIRGMNYHDWRDISIKMDKSKQIFHKVGKKVIKNAIAVKQNVKIFMQVLRCVSAEHKWLYSSIIKSLQSLTIYSTQWVNRVNWVLDYIFKIINSFKSLIEILHDLIKIANLSL